MDTHLSVFCRLNESRKDTERRRKRRNHAPSFKAKVALAAARGDQTIAEIAEQFDLHPNQVQQWRKPFLANAIDLFGEGARQSPNRESEIKSLHARLVN